TRAQIARVRSIVADLDNPQQGAVDIIALKHISAGEALHIAGQLVQFQGQNLSIVEDVHKNRLIISGNPTVRQDLKALIRQLDVAQGDMGGIEVVRLNYAQAEPMKVLLEGILKSSLFSRKVLGEGK